MSNPEIISPVLQYEQRVKMNINRMKWIVTNVMDEKISTKYAAAPYIVSRSEQGATADEKYPKSGKVPKLDWKRRPHRAYSNRNALSTVSGTKPEEVHAYSTLG